MGFGIPRPTWFQLNSTLAPVTQWLLHVPPVKAEMRNSAAEEVANYEEVVWLSKEDVFGLPPFNYYASVLHT